jgi:cation-transporting ATPase E
MGVAQPELRTGATIILAVIGIWVLAVLARPIDRWKGLVIGAMFVALLGIFTIPLSTGFFQLIDPGEDAAYLVAGITVLTIGGIEIVRAVHRRFVVRALGENPFAELSGGTSDFPAAPRAPRR